MSSTAIVLGVAGVAVVGVGLALAGQKAEAEKQVDTLAPGAPGAKSPNVPTHTDQPEAEQQQTTLRQLLVSYQSSLARLESERMTIEFDRQQAEAAGATACTGYAQDPVFTYRCNGFPVCGWNEWHELTGQQTNQTVLQQCKASVTGFGGLTQRTVEMRGNNNQAAWEKLMGIIRQGLTQANAAASRYQEAQGRLRSIDQQIQEVRTKIADLNARGVY